MDGYYSDRILLIIIEITGNRKDGNDPKARQIKDVKS